MTFNRKIWYPIAGILTAINLAGFGFAVGEPGSWHAGIHAALTLGFGLWAYRLRQGPGGSDLQDRMEALEGEVNKLRQELSETQERVDFAERVLAQGSEARRVGPQR